MTQNQTVFNFLRWAIFLFIALGISSSMEHKLAVSVGSQLSPAFAQGLADSKKEAQEQMAKDPDGARRAGYQMTVAKFTVRGITAIILAGFIVWFRKDSRSMLKTASEVSHQ